MHKTSDIKAESTSRRLLWLIGKLSKCKNGGWFGIAECTKEMKSYWIWSDRWFPCNSPLVIGYSTDFFMVVDAPSTIDKNSYEHDWLADNQDKLTTTSLNILP
ncbi:hypothetical protein [Prochlorococcus sp. MIT 1223]|uniref:hypothetical protein n=1 Tax=Prochlorococcus sp. MIT 1223 TaxID=3096217 RepID=UPI002A765011|nr:hypothetical protein [Prochlorococcus sp. MIT 1223]